METLFGTDGIRGRANSYPMTPEIALKVGRAVAAFFENNSAGHSKIIIGKDTRISGDMLESALAAGICSMGMDVYLTGILPTPGIAYLAAKMDFAAGIVISASHNPYFDNGIKLFNGDGFKLTDNQEKEIENLILADTQKKHDDPKIGRIRQMHDAVDRYVNFLAGTVDRTLQFNQIKAVLDCANGATYQVAPKLFEQLGLQIETLFNIPNGMNINAQCGSQHPETLGKKVVALNADIGLAFDGDGDRLIVVDETGEILSGDQILAICAQDMQQKGLLKKNRVVSTIMSNMGLRQALKKMGIKHQTTKVGDRYVMEEMLAADAVLGGEDSGHMIFLDYHSTGDGLLAAIRLLTALSEEPVPLSQRSKIMTIFPQVLINVDVSSKPNFETLPEVTKAITAAESRLGADGRVLVRYSGTQPQCRIMVEGPDMDIAKSECRAIADIIQNTIGAGNE